MTSLRRIGTVEPELPGGCCRLQEVRKDAGKGNAGKGTGLVLFWYLEVPHLVWSTL